MLKIINQLWKAAAFGLPSALVIVGFAIWIEYVTGASVSAIGLLSNAILPILIGVPIILLIENRNTKLRQATKALNTMREECEKRDGMTGAYNHKHFMERITQNAENNDGSLIILDIDHFKHINEKYGHLQGDAALIHVVNAVRKAVRAHDVVGRIGGEEFAVFLQHASKEEAKVVASRIRQCVEEIDFKPQDGVRAPLTVSVGVAMNNETENVVSAMTLADRRMFKARETGRNKVVNSGSKSEVVKINSGG